MSPGASMRQSARSVDMDVRRGRRSLGSRSGVGEDEDRLGLHTRRTKEPETLVPDARHACAREGGRVPASYGSAGMDTTRPCRSRGTPSGPTYRSTLTQADGSSSCSRIPSASQSR